MHARLPHPFIRRRSLATSLVLLAMVLTTSSPIFGCAVDGGPVNDDGAGGKADRLPILDACARVPTSRAGRYGSLYSNGRCDEFCPVYDVEDCGCPAEEQIEARDCSDLECGPLEAVLDDAEDCGCGCVVAPVEDRRCESESDCFVGELCEKEPCRVTEDGGECPKTGTCRGPSGS